MKKAARIELNVKDEGDLDFSYRWVYDAYCAEFTIVVSEHNRVAGKVYVFEGSSPSRVILFFLYFSTT